MNVLGIETSCDETAISCVNDKKEIIWNSVYTQSVHAKFGGVVPEVAARNHLEILPTMLKEFANSNCFKDGNTDPNEVMKKVDAISVTSGPGLIGSVIIGVIVAKVIASIFRKPIIPVNHLEGHALTQRLVSNLDFPYLLLLISGGHSQILVVHGVSKYELLCDTIDDAVGEAFDKVAKMLDIGYPGGLKVESLAEKADRNDVIKFSHTFYKTYSPYFSFSGLKTAVMYHIKNIGKESLCEEKNNICASFQHHITLMLQQRLEQVLDLYLSNSNEKRLKKLVISGGVAANKYIKSSITNTAIKYGIEVLSPPQNLCTDNAAMIAWAGIEKILSKGLLDASSDINFAPKSRWPLTELV